MPEPTRPDEGTATGTEHRHQPPAPVANTSGDPIGTLAVHRQSGYLIVAVVGCTRATPDSSLFGHEPICGWEPVASLDELRKIGLVLADQAPAAPTPSPTGSNLGTAEPPLGLATVEAALAAARAAWDDRTGPYVSDTMGTEDMLRDITEAVLGVAARARHPEPPADLREAIARALWAASGLDREENPAWFDKNPDRGFWHRRADAVLPVVQAHVAAEVERARAEGAAQALRAAADAYEAFANDTAAATAFAYQHYQAGGPHVPTLWLKHRADEIATGGEH
jgi:hypothetical protein